jgi:hypothetical protein
MKPSNRRRRVGFTSVRRTAIRFCGYILDPESRPVRPPGLSKTYIRPLTCDLPDLSWRGYPDGDHAGDLELQADANVQAAPASPGRTGHRHGRLRRAATWHAMASVGRRSWSASQGDYGPNSHARSKRLRFADGPCGSCPETLGSPRLGVLWSESISTRPPRRLHTVSARRLKMQ